MLQKRKVSAAKLSGNQNGFELLKNLQLILNWSLAWELSQLCEIPSKVDWEFYFPVVFLYFHNPVSNTPFPNVRAFLRAVHPHRGIISAGLEWQDSPRAFGGFGIPKLPRSRFRWGWDGKSSRDGRGGLDTHRNFSFLPQPNFGLAGLSSREFHFKRGSQVRIISVRGQNKSWKPEGLGSKNDRGGV